MNSEMTPTRTATATMDRMMAAISAADIPALADDPALKAEFKFEATESEVVIACPLSESLPPPAPGEPVGPACPGLEEEMVTPPPLGGVRCAFGEAAGTSGVVVMLGSIAKVLDQKRRHIGHRIINY